MSRTRVMVVDDSVVVRRLLKQILESDPDVEVSSTAPNGRIALQKLPLDNPDLVVLDVEMPELDGLATLREIRHQRPSLPVIMFSTVTRRGALATLDALAAGATDYATKPEAALGQAAAAEEVRSSLLTKIKGLRPSRPTRDAPRREVRPADQGSLRPTSTTRVEAVVIGCSTGGPNALSELFPGLDGALPVPLLVVQHMPPTFTRLLAERLTKMSGFPVSEAAEGATALAGRAFVAPGNYHMRLRWGPAGAVIGLDQGPHENSCRPSVDVLFRTAAKLYGPGLLAVVLTGMGKDGLRGAEAVVEAGGSVLVQDAASSVVWGMPGFVAQAGLAEAVLPISELAGAIRRRVARGRSPALPAAPLPAGRPPRSGGRP